MNMTIDPSTMSEASTSRNLSKNIQKSQYLTKTDRENIRRQNDDLKKAAFVKDLIQQVEDGSAHLNTSLEKYWKDPQPKFDMLTIDVNDTLGPRKHGYIEGGVQTNLSGKNKKNIQHF